MRYFFKMLVFALILFSSGVSSAVNNPFIIDWQAQNNAQFLNSLFQGVFGRPPTQADINFFINRDLGRNMGRGEAFWSLVASQDYRNMFGDPQGPYHIRWKSRQVNDERGMWWCRCYFFTKDPSLTGGHPAVMQYLGVRTPWDRYSFTVAQAVTMMYAVYDNEVCVSLDCGLGPADVAARLGRNNGNNGGDGRNLVRDPNFSRFLSNPVWGSGVLYGEKGLWWNSRNAGSTARTVQLEGGNIRTALYIMNPSSRAAHVFGTTAQRITVIPGRSYQISFFGKAKGLASNGGITIAVDPQWKICPVTMNAGTYDWEKFSGTFRADSSYIDLRIISQDRGEVWITGMMLVLL